jgi:TPR repeat protein
MTLPLKHVVVAIILILCFAAPAAAGPLEMLTLRLKDATTRRPNAHAQYNLGVLYDNGLGVPLDKVRAYVWFTLSAAQGREGAATFRDLIARRMTPAQIDEAQKLAREWKPTQPPSR